MLPLAILPEKERYKTSCPMRVMTPESNATVTKRRASMVSS
ncbi:hypothetical protein [Rhizobium deserti]|nr:hypothetical protein [Rhizobium deserti]